MPPTRSHSAKNSVADRANTISVGSASQQRQIVNVAPGTAPTDAVNLSQLQAVSESASRYFKANGNGLNDESDHATADGLNAAAIGSSALAAGEASLAAGTGAEAQGEFQHRGRRTSVRAGRRGHGTRL